MKSYITEILIKNFRNHSYFHLVPSCRNILLYGGNGTGKTSLIESVSKLCPGLGLRSAKNDEIIKHGTDLWELNCKIKVDEQSHVVGISYSNRKKSIRIDGEPVKNANQIVELIKVIWFTPQICSLFFAEISVRRKFFDRLIAVVFPDHLAHLLLYDKLKVERNKLLATRQSKEWLDIVEAKIASISIDIIGVRESFLGLLKDKLNSMLNAAFTLDCEVANEVSDILSLEEKQARIVELLLKGRHLDQLTGKMNLGTHRADFKMTIAGNAGKSCSTGEQKSLLLSLILACADLVDVILLDDISSNLDVHNFKFFISEAMKKDCQFFFTDLQKENYDDHINNIYMLQLDK